MQGNQQRDRESRRLTMKSHLFCCHRFRKRNCRLLPKSKVYWLVSLALALIMLVNIGEIGHHVRSRWLQTVAHSLHASSNALSDQFYNEVVNSFPIKFPDNRSLQTTGDRYLNDGDVDWSKYRINVNPEVDVQWDESTESLININNVTLKPDRIPSNTSHSVGVGQPVKNSTLKELASSSAILEIMTSEQGAEKTLHDKPTDNREPILEIKNMTSLTLESSGVGQQLISTTQPHTTTVQQPTATARAFTTEPNTPLNTTHRVVKVESKNCSEVILSQLVGRFTPSMKEETQEEILAKIPELQIGGTYKPKDCISDEKTAIIIPYRDRWYHLHILLPVLLPMLMRQKVTFTLFVVAQEPPETFNKGLLFNAGFLEALKLDNFTCFILHDVDMIPADDRNLYRCDKKNPTHFGVSIDKFKFKLPYNGLFGGVTAFTTEQFQKVNGASNMYFGWGAEDDDLRERILNKKYTMARKSPGTAIYYMVKHSQKEAGWQVNNKRSQIFKMARQRQDIDGLNSAVYNTTSIKRLPLYTWINVDIDQAQVLRTVPIQMRESPTVQRPAMKASIQGYLPKAQTR